MKNLLERLNSDTKQKLENIRDEYPSTYGFLIDSLTKNYFYTDVEFKTVLSFNTFLKIELIDFQNQFNN